MKHASMVLTSLFFLSIMSGFSHGNPLIGNVSFHSFNSVVPNSNGSVMGICSCWCKCWAQGTGRTCNGVGFCCIGAKARYFNQTCVCWPCFFFFGSEKLGQRTACLPPDFRVMEQHILKLFKGSHNFIRKSA